MHRAGISLARRANDFRRPPRRSLTQNLNSGPDSNVLITTLPNNIRVATQATPGHFSSVGLFVDAGSRYETPFTSGASHFLDRMTFKSTSTRSNDEMATAVQALDGRIVWTALRECIMYYSCHFHQATPQALSLIADTVLNPAFLPEEIEAQRDAARYEIRKISNKPDQILPEILHHVAYGGRGLGNSLLCPEERIDLINGHILQMCQREWYRPERMVIAGAGMPHEQLVELTDKYFSSLKSTVLGAASPLARSVPPPLSTSVSPLATPPTASDSPDLINSIRPSYTGGHRFIYDNKSEFNHLYIAFEGAGHHDDDVYALTTMQVLLGGGGRFSAGGPGNGMYSRLHTQILNRHPQINHCESFYDVYADSALFGLFASFVPYAKDWRGGSTPAQILPHLVNQLSHLIDTPIPAAEFRRAKNQLKSALMMSFERRSCQVESLGRRILLHGRQVAIKEMTEKIDRLKPEDIRKTAERVFGLQSGGKPTVVCMGHEDTGAWEEVFDVLRC